MYIDLLDWVINNETSCKAESGETKKYISSATKVSALHIGIEKRKIKTIKTFLIRKIYLTMINKVIW